MNDTTKRMATTTALSHLRNVRNRIAAITLHRANNGFLTPEESQELAELQTRRIKLEREYADSLKLDETRTS